jgi:Zn-dependent protease with chaperone function
VTEKMRITSYRYPNEQLILAGTLLLVVIIIALTATATVCTSLIFIIAFVLIAYQTGAVHHQQLVRSAKPVTPSEMPGLARLVEDCVNRIKPDQVEVYLLPSRELNAYTFGLDSPKVVVLYSSLLKVMDDDEIKFIIGHELGHVALGHTWLNSLVGGIAGIPSSFSAAALMSMAFLSWNRACEYSADRAGLLACGKPDKAISALIKLVAGPQSHSSQAMAAAYQQIDAQDDTFLGNLNEALASHPLMIRRINQLREFARSRQYQQLNARLAAQSASS